jgi:hypothetical protein
MELGMPWSVGSMAEQTKRLEQAWRFAENFWAQTICDFVQYR